MKPRSRIAFGFMKKVAAGQVQVPGVSKQQAAKAVEGMNYRTLPNRVGKKNDSQ